jgi:hypothetical protein
MKLLILALTLASSPLFAQTAEQTQQTAALQQENLELRARIAQLEFDLNESERDIEPYFADSKPFCPRDDYEVKYKVQMKTICAGVRTIPGDSDNGYQSSTEETGCEPRRVFVPVCRKRQTAGLGSVIMAAPMAGPVKR